MGPKIGGYLSRIDDTSGHHAAVLYGRDGKIKLEIDEQSRATFFDGAFSIGRSATVTVAASNASSAEKAQADIVCSGANDHIQIQEALDILDARGGGRCGFSEGDFYIAASINIASNISLFGMGPTATTLRLVNTGAPINLLQTKNYATVRSMRIHIKDLLLLGDSTGGNAGTCFYANMAYSRLENVWMQDASVDGMVLDCQTGDTATENVLTGCQFRKNGGIGLHLKGSVREIFLNSNFVYSNTGTGIKIEGESVKIAQHIYLTNNWIEDNDHGVEVVDGQNLSFMGNEIAQNGKHGVYIHKVLGLSSSGFVFTGNIFYSDGMDATDTYDSINIDGLSGTYKALRLLATGNRFAGNNKTRYYINLGANSANGLVSSNNFGSGTVVTAPVIDSGTGNIVRDNLGHVTENHGTAASVADGGTIAHGLAAAPTFVSVASSVAGEIATVSGVDGTNITVDIKDNDGSAGTTQTIYWKAEV